MLWVCDVWWSDPERHICASSHYCLLCMTSHWSDSRYHLFLHILLVPLVLFTPMNIALQRLVFIANLSEFLFAVSTYFNTSSGAVPRATRRPPVIATHSKYVVHLRCGHDSIISLPHEGFLERAPHLWDSTYLCIISQLSRFLPIADLKSPVAVLSCCRGQQSQIGSTCVRSVEYSVTCQTVTTHPQEGQSKLEPR